MNNVFNRIKYIFSDFDGTISKYDVIHSFITSFSKGDWTVAEKLWSMGKISTKECLRTQFDLITGLKKSVLDDFLNSIEIDPYFIEFYKLIKKYNKEIIILSDGFDIFIKTTLKKYGLEDIKVYSNLMNIKEKDGFIQFELLYPNINKKCLISSGCCKCEVAQKYTKDYIYIGDGLSDRCIAKKSSLLFAKKSLETFCKNENISYFPYKTFQDIIDALIKEKNDAQNDVRHPDRIQNKRN